MGCSRSLVLPVWTTRWVDDSGIVPPIGQDKGHVGVGQSLTEGNKGQAVGRNPRAYAHRRLDRHPSQCQVFEPKRLDGSLQSDRGALVAGSRRTDPVPNR
jgi:hypothetical protein